MTEFAALATARSGSWDSAAAMVATSAPVIEKITVTIAAVIAQPPLGRQPPWAVRLEQSVDSRGHNPTTNAPPMAGNSIIAATLLPANQHPNTATDETANRLVAVIADG